MGREGKGRARLVPAVPFGSTGEGHGQPPRSELALREDPKAPEAVEVGRERCLKAPEPPLAQQVGILSR